MADYLLPFPQQTLETRGRGGRGPGTGGKLQFAAAGSPSAMREVDTPYGQLGKYRDGGLKKIRGG